MAQCLFMELGRNSRAKAYIYIYINSIDIYGGSPQATVSFTYTGDGEITAESDNPTVATASIVGKSVVINYGSVGKANITINAKKTSAYTAAVASFTVNCYKSSVPKPSLATTYYDVTEGTTCTPGYNNFNGNAVTASGSTSANATGTYTIYFNIKDKNRYCWADGSDGTISCTWRISGTTYVYNKTVGYADGATVTFTGNEGGASGNYCWYETNGNTDILMEMKGTGSGITTKYVTFALNKTMPAGSTLYINAYTYGYLGLSDNVNYNRLYVLISNDGKTYTQISNEYLPTKPYSISIPFNTTHIRIKPSLNTMTVLHQVYYKK